MNTIISCNLQILFSKVSLRLDRFCSWIFQDRVLMYPSLSCNSVLQTQPALNSEMAFVSLGLDYVTNTWLLRLSIQWPKLVFGWLPVLSFFFPLGLFQDRIWLFWNSLCIPGWPHSYLPASPSHVELKGMCHHILSRSFQITLYFSYCSGNRIYTTQALVWHFQHRTHHLRYK